MFPAKASIHENNVVALGVRRSRSLYQWLKYPIDVVVASILCVMLLPVILIITALTSPGRATSSIFMPTATRAQRYAGINKGGLG